MSVRGTQPFACEHCHSCGDLAVGKPLAPRSWNRTIISERSANADAKRLGKVRCRCTNRIGTGCFAPLSNARHAARILRLATTDGETSRFRLDTSTSWPASPWRPTQCIRVPDPLIPLLLVGNDGKRSATSLNSRRNRQGMVAYSTSSDAWMKCQCRLSCWRILFLKNTSCAFFV